MPQHDDGQPAARPHVVQVIFSALTDMDPARLEPLKATGITPAEQKQADELYLASIQASFGQRERFTRAMEVLIGDRKFSTPPGWTELFDGLTPKPPRSYAASTTLSLMTPAPNTTADTGDPSRSEQGQPHTPRRYGESLLPSWPCAPAHASRARARDITRY